MHCVTGTINEIPSKQLTMLIYNTKQHQVSSNGMILRQAVLKTWLVKTRQVQHMMFMMGEQV